jgi:hypothetical protein
VRQPSLIAQSEVRLAEWKTCSEFGFGLEN